VGPFELSSLQVAAHEPGECQPGHHTRHREGWTDMSTISKGNRLWSTQDADWRIGFGKARVSAGEFRRHRDGARQVCAPPLSRRGRGSSRSAASPREVKNWLFAGRFEGARRAALLYSLVQSCKLVDVPPFDYLKDVLLRVATHPHRLIGQLTPKRWAETFGNRVAAHPTDQARAVV
jgi:hypothetical protein